MRFYGLTSSGLYDIRYVMGAKIQSCIIDSCIEYD